MATPISRPSLDTTLEQRYAAQQAGGSFDAKDIETSGGRASLSKGGTSFQSAIWTPAGFKTRMALLATELKAKALKFIDSQGFNSRKYKP
jgi:hypothetical protein